MTGLTTGNEAGVEDIARDDIEYEEYPELREFVRKIPCVVCQWERKQAGEQDLLVHNQNLDYVPELARISDPHHVKTVGSGGPDAENLVSMCREHHTELGDIGSMQFQIDHNINLKQIALEIYDLFLQSGMMGESSAKVFAEHQRLVSRLDGVRKAMVDCADHILAFIETSYAGKPTFEWLGFSNYSQYATAPVSSGGLGLKERTAYRLLAMSRVKKLLGDDEERAKKLGTYKSEIILPVLRKEEDPEKRARIADAVGDMSLADAIQWKNDMTGTVDKRQTLRDNILITLKEFLCPNGFTDEDLIESLSWAVMKTIDSSRKG